MKAIEITIKLDTGEILTATGDDAQSLYRGMQAFETICGIVALTSGLYRNSARVKQSPSIRNPIPQE